MSQKSWKISSAMQRKLWIPSQVWFMNLGSLSVIRICLLIIKPLSTRESVCSHVFKPKYYDMSTCVIIKQMQFVRMLELLSTREPVCHHIINLWMLGHFNDIVLDKGTSWSWKDFSFNSYPWLPSVLMDIVFFRWICPSSSRSILNDLIKISPKSRKINKPWPKANHSWTWWGYISISNFRSFLPSILHKLPENLTDGRMDGRTDADNSYIPIPLCLWGQ